MELIKVKLCILPYYFFTAIYASRLQVDQFPASGSRYSLLSCLKNPRIGVTGCCPHVSFLLFSSATSFKNASTLSSKDSNLVSCEIRNSYLQI